MQRRSEIPNLYTGEDKLHFNNQLANQAYDSMISKTRQEALEKFGPNYIVLIISAGRKAAGNQSTSMTEAFCAKQLSLCRNTRDLINWQKWIPNVVRDMNIIWYVCQRCYIRLIDTFTRSYNVWKLQHWVNQTNADFTMMKRAKSIYCTSWQPLRGIFAV